MISFIAAVILLLIALSAITLRKTYYYLPEAELKRQARSGDALAKTLHRAVAYGSNLRLLLWLIIGVCTAVGLELFVRVAPIYFGVIMVAIVLWLGFAWMPSTQLTGYGARVAVGLTPVIVWLLEICNPLFSRLTDWWHKHVPILKHSGLYERIDLAELIEHQKQQPDNRIAGETLDLMSHALHFDEYHVRDVAVPRKSVVAVAAKTTVGPILLDELHASGYARFPVYNKSPDDIVGTLQLLTLDEARSGGKASEYMDGSPAFLHESDSLPEALQAVYHTKQQLFVVINDFDEYVGVVTLEDILQQLVGQLKESDFDAHHDRAAVASKHPAKSKLSSPKEESEPEKVSDDSVEVVK